MIPEKTIKDRWASFDSKRTSKLQKARIHASVTIPTLLPLQSTSQEQYIPNQHSSVQSRGVTSLASKILSVLIPLNDTPFFTFGLKSGKEPSAEIASYLATLSVQVFKKLSSNNLREIAYLAIQHLIVLGDVLIVMENDFSFRVVRLDQFVIKREVNGDVTEAIYLEFLAPDCDEPVNSYDFQSGVDNQPGYKTVYVRCYKNENNEWEVQKELDGKIIDKGFYDVLPLVFLRWSTIAGEDYGRSHVEDIYADIYSLEAYTKAMKQGMAAGATFFMGIDPSGITEVDDLSLAQNGDWVPARKQDVYVISPSETLKPQLAASSTAVDAMRKEVGSGFLMQTATMPTGDRVTATAIRAIGNELETILGGTFSSIAREFMVPVVQRTIYLMLQKQEIDPKMAGKFDKDSGVLDIEILTGLQSLSKESDLTKLLQMGEMIKNLPQPAAASFKWEEYAKALIYSLGFDPANWVKSEEQLKKEQEQIAQAQHAAEKDKIMTQGLANTVEAGATQFMKEKGTDAVTPEMVQGAQQMFTKGVQQ